jgi:hypothetical protein
MIAIAKPGCNAGDLARLKLRKDTQSIISTFVPIDIGNNSKPIAKSSTVVAML